MTLLNLSHLLYLTTYGTRKLSHNKLKPDIHINIVNTQVLDLFTHQKIN